jgi:N-acetylglucosaminyldiphosphoundecaprenol N-acetyl-beta-D-mannosaminyltransferase
VETCNVLGIPLALTDYAGAVEHVKTWAAAGDAARLIAAANVHVSALARHHPDYRQALNCFDLILPDGMPLVWVINRRVAHPLNDRVYGPTFMLRCLEETQGQQWRHVFIGGTPEVLRALETEVITKFPGLSLAPSYSPPFGDWGADEDERILQHIREAGAQFVWIGLGCPKQEYFLARLKPKLPPGCYAAVGAAFAFHAGRVRQAPRWMQDRGLEWLYRLCTEPGRLWKRYLVFNTLFLLYLAIDSTAPARARS